MLCHGHPISSSENTPTAPVASLRQGPTMAVATMDVWPLVRWTFCPALRRGGGLGGCDQHVCVCVCPEVVAFSSFG